MKEVIKIYATALVIIIIMLLYIPALSWVCNLVNK